MKNVTGAPLEQRWGAASRTQIVMIDSQHPQHPQAHEWIDAFISEFVDMLARAQAKAEREELIRPLRSHEPDSPLTRRSVDQFVYSCIEQEFCVTARHGNQDEDFKARFSYNRGCSFYRAKKIKRLLDFDMDEAAALCTTINLRRFRVQGGVCLDECGMGGPGAEKTGRACVMPTKDDSGRKLIAGFRLAATLQQTKKRVLLAHRWQRAFNFYQVAEHLTWVRETFHGYHENIHVVGDAGFCDIQDLKSEDEIRMTVHYGDVRGLSLPKLVGRGLEDGEHRHFLDGPVFVSAVRDGETTNIAASNAYMLARTMAHPATPRSRVARLSSVGVQALSRLPLPDLKMLAHLAGFSTSTCDAVRCVVCC
jgi:hypothetical protein